MSREGFNPKPRVLVSYARQDSRELALRLDDHLKRAGYDVWLDMSNVLGGATWSRGIEVAIEDCDVELALLSAGSFSSEICRAEQVRALRRGKRVVPLLSERNVWRPLYFEHLNYLDFSDPARFAESFQELIVDLKSNQTTPLPEARRSTTITAPPLPITFVPRPSELKALRLAIIGDGGGRQIALTALGGMGGIGKNRAALCRDEIVQAAFPDGIVWVTIGREPKSLLSQMREVGRCSAMIPRAMTHRRLASTVCARSCRTKLCFWCWMIFGMPATSRAPRRSALLSYAFTTRNSSIALFLGAKTVKLDTLKPEQAKELLHEWAQRDDPRLGQIAERLGYLPLALKLAGSRLREGLSGEEWLQTFHHVSQIKSGRFATDPTDNLQVCFDLSRDRLPEADRSLYHALGIFPQDTPIPVGVIVRLWKRISSTLSEFDCDELLTEMARLELIERRPDKTVMKHDLLHDYMRGNLGDRSKHTHCELLSAYNPSAEPWWEIPHDGYLYFHLAWHLKEAERLQELRQLLSNFRWLTAKLESADILSLITDYDYLPQDADLRTVQAALLQSAHILAGNHRELPGQLLAASLKV